MKKSLFLKSITTVLLTFYVMAGTYAQTKDEKIMQEIQNDIDQNYSKRMEKALKQDMGRYNKMKSDLEEVGKVKENSGKKKGLDNYKAAHRDYFGKAMQEAGVKLDDLLAGLQRKYTGYNFSIVDDYGILVQRIGSTDLATSTGDLQERNEDHSGSVTLSYAHGPNAESDLRSLSNENSALSFQDLSFTQSKSVNCGLGAGGDVEFGYRTVKAVSTAVIAGGCSSFGNLTNRTLIPATGVTNVKLTLNGTLESSGSALGILGTSLSVARPGIFARVLETGTVLLDDKTNTLDLQIAAPALWFASFNKSYGFNYSIDLNQWTGKTIEVYGRAFTNSVSVLCCGTNATAKLSITTSAISMLRIYR